MPRDSRQAVRADTRPDPRTTSSRTAVPGTAAARTTTAGPARGGRDNRTLYWIAALLVASTVTWRRAVYFSGGVDPVVAVKALLNVFALVMAILAAHRCSTRYRLSSRSSVVLGLLLITGLLGSWYSATAFSSTVLTVRIAVLAITVDQTVRAFGATRFLRAFATWLAVVVAFAALTGLAEGSAGHLAGRLAGGIPPLQPNEIAEGGVIVLLCLVDRCLETRFRVVDGLAVAALVAIVLATGSRTGLIAVVLALVIRLIQTRRLPIGVVVSMLALVPVVVYVLLATSAATNYVNRGGTQNVTSLSDRTVAWSSAIDFHHGFWPTYFGSGLSVVQVPVSAQFREVQLLDSSWLSALVQTGVLGIALFGLWVALGAQASLRAPAATRPLLTALTAFVVVRSILESGLMGATPSFIVFMTASLTAAPAVDRVKRRISSAAYIDHRRDTVRAST